jgi:hypothetical protein
MIELNISNIPEKVTSSINVTVEKYLAHLDNRNSQLFTRFLPCGYEFVTLSSVDDNHKQELIIAKCHVGIFITLLDDYADNPSMANPELLKELHKIPYYTDSLDTSNLTEHENNIVQLAFFIANEFIQRMRLLPAYEKYKNIFEFDLMQFINCNKYFSLATHHPDIINKYEISQWGPFNMGMVIIGMLDIMASPNFVITELGTVREIFYLAQRFGHICNTLTTFSRELIEHDYANEIIVTGLSNNIINKNDIKTLSADELIKKLQVNTNLLVNQRLDILTQLNCLAEKTSSFDVKEYITGLNRLQLLHEYFIGII